MHVDKAKNDCFFSLGAVHSQPCVSLTQQKALCYRVVGSEHQEAQQMLFGHTLTLSLSFTLTLTHNYHTWLDYCIHHDLYQVGKCYWEQVANPYCCVKYIFLTKWHERFSKLHFVLRQTIRTIVIAACKIKKCVSTKRRLHNLPCTLSPARDMQLKVQVYGGFCLPTLTEH